MSVQQEQNNPHVGAIAPITKPWLNPMTVSWPQIEQGLKNIYDLDGCTIQMVDAQFNLGAEHGEEFVLKLVLPWEQTLRHRVLKTLEMIGEIKPDARRADSDNPKKDGLMFDELTLRMSHTQVTTLMPKLAELINKERGIESPDIEKAKPQPSAEKQKKEPTPPAKIQVPAVAARLNDKGLDPEKVTWEQLEAGLREVYALMGHEKTQIIHLEDNDEKTRITIAVPKGMKWDENLQKSLLDQGFESSVKANQQPVYWGFGKNKPPAYHLDTVSCEILSVKLPEYKQALARFVNESATGHSNQIKHLMSIQKGTFGKKSNTQQSIKIG